MPDLYARAVTDHEFRQRVRRHAPSRLLPELARAGAAHAQPGSWIDRRTYHKFTPWNLAEVARTSIVFGNEHRMGPVTELDVLQCCAALVSVDDPALHGSPDDDPGAFFLRLGHDQLDFQRAWFNGIARTAALLRDTTASRPTTIITKGRNWTGELLGCSLDAFIAAGFLLLAAAQAHQGHLAAGWLSSPDLDPAFVDVTRQDLLQGVDAYTATLDNVRARNPRYDGHPNLRRFSYNPLFDTPVLRGIVNNDYLIPVPALLPRKMSPLGLYYSGMTKWGEAFSRDYGYLFEDYVGRQLRQLQVARNVWPERTYTAKKQELKSVDWIVELDEVILLVEAKSRRPSDSVRRGAAGAAPFLRARLGDSINQLDRTAQLIQNQHPKFVDIPNDRPLVGVIVTLEAFQSINSPFVREWLPEARIPTTFCSAAELEYAVTLEGIPSLGSVLLQLTSDPDRRGWSLGPMLVGRQHRRNVVLDEAWNSYPWVAGAHESNLMRTDTAG